MNGFLAAALGYREFWPGDEVRAAVAVRAEITHRKQAADRRYGSSHELIVKVDPRGIRLMLLFTTPTQRSWLAVDQSSVYGVLDDLRKDEPPVVRWLAHRTDAHPVKANHDHSPTSGILYLGRQRSEWFYSKDLFQDRDVVEAIQNLLGGDGAGSSQ